MKKAFDPIVTTSSRLLILGTMPGEKSLEISEYYGNRGNHFWRLLFTVLGEEFSFNYPDRLALLYKHNIALWDVLSSCEREGSLDNNIKNEVPNDFDYLYDLYPNITSVYFSSKNAEKYYRKYVGLREGIYYDTLPSPSGAYASKLYSEKLKEWRDKILPQTLPGRAAAKI